MAPLIAHRPSRRGIARIGAASSMLLGLVVLGPSAVADDDQDTPPEAPFDITQKVLEDSVTRYDAEGSITRYDAADSVTALGGTDTQEEALIVLEADILFPSNTWDLPDDAADRVAELASDIPDGATVQVEGHTDSLPVDRSQYDFDNQQLSEHRAQAVVDALSEQRPDLVLEAEGFGDQEPSVSEDPEDPSTAAANRRVELHYQE